MICSNCLKEIKDNSKFCIFCGNKIVNFNKNKVNVINNIDEKSDEYKKIKNAGATGEALGWFNLFFGPISLFINNTEDNSDFLVINLIYFLIISLIFIKYGKKIKMVNGARIKDINILLIISIFIIGINILSSISDGKFIGILFVLEMFYLLKARSVVKKVLNY